MVARPPKQVQALDTEDLTAYNIEFDDNGQVVNIQHMESPLNSGGNPKPLDNPVNETRVLMDMANSDPDTVSLRRYEITFKGEGETPEVKHGAMNAQQTEEMREKIAAAQTGQRVPVSGPANNGGTNVPVRTPGNSGQETSPAPSNPQPPKPKFKINDSAFNGMVKEFCTDLTEKFQERKDKGKNDDPVLERDDERQKVVRALLHKDRANAAVLGDPGVGKTVMFDALAYDVINGADHVPEKMRSAQVINVDIQAMNAGASRVTNEFEKRLKSILEGAEERNKAFFETGYGHPVILCIDEFHQIMDPRIGAADLIKPLLSRGDGLQVAIATTADEYDKHIAKDPALDRRFYGIMVNEPDKETTMTIAKGKVKEYGEFHDVSYTDEIVDRAIGLTNRYLRERFQPAKAIDALDAAGALAHQRGVGDVTEDLLIEAVADQAKLDPKFIGQGEEQRILSLAEELPKWVQGQDDALEAIPSAMIEAKAGLNDPNRPFASFLLRGPTGVGKTETGKALAKLLYGSEDKLLAIDMSNYTEKHDAKNFTGSPPSYVGYGEKTALSDLRKDPMKVVMFDEIEKAHPDVYKHLMSILDEGRITTGDNKTIDFKNTVVIMTTNLGAKEAEFARKGGAMTQSNEVDEAEAERNAERAYEQAWKQGNFPPEFRGRVDAVLTYKSLSQKVVDNLVMNRIKTVSERLTAKHPNLVNIRVEGDALDELKAQSYTPDKGARGLNQAVKQSISQPLAKALLEMKVNGEEITEKSEIVVTGLGKDFAFHAEPVKTPANQNDQAAEKATQTAPKKKAASGGPKPKV